MVNSPLAQPAFVQPVTLRRRSHEASWRFLVCRLKKLVMRMAVLGCDDTTAQISSLTDAAENPYQLAIGHHKCFGPHSDEESSAVP